MSKSVVVGRADVIVRAVTSQVRQQIKRAFADALPDIRAAGVEHGKAYSEGFGGGMGADMQRTMSRNIGEGGRGAENIGAQHGSQYAGGFGNGFGGLDLGDALRRATQQAVNDAQRDIDSSASRLSGSSRRAFGGAGRDGGNAFSRALRSGFADSAVSASRSLTKLIAASNIVGPAIGGLVSGISAAISGLFAFAAAAANAAGALAVLPGMISVAAQAMLTLKLAFSGVGAAVSAGFKPATSAVSGAGAAARAATAAVADALQNLGRARADAADSIADAEQNLARTQADAARSIRDAQDSVRDARESAARAAADAARQVQNAESELASSERDLTAARRELNDAYREGAEELQQLAFDAEDAALAEERAGLRLQDAYTAMRAAQELPADDRARVEAELSYKEAELAYREAKDRSADLKKEQTTAAREGVRGTDAVTSAQERVNSAVETVRDNEQALADARRSQAQTHRDNLESIADAEQGLADARRSAAQSVADAQEALADAHQAAARSIADAEEAVREARQRATEAQNEQTGATDAYQTALDNLAPAQRRFAEYLVSIKDKLDSLKAAIGVDLFPKLQSAIEPIVNRVFPLLERELRVTGSLLGDAAEGATNMFRKGQRNRLGQVLRGNNDILEIFTKQGKSGENTFSKLVRVMLRLAVAIQPITGRFARWIDSLIRGAAAATNTKKEMHGLTGFFNRAGDTAALLGHIFGNLFDILGSLSKAARPAGNGLLKSFEGATGALAKFLDTPKQQKVLRKFFHDSAWNLRKIGDLIVVIGDEFFKLGNNRAIGRFADSLQPAVRIAGDIARELTDAAPALGPLAENVGRVVLALSQSEGIRMFVDNLSWAIDKVADLLETPVAGKVLAWAAAIAAFTRVAALMLIPIRFIGTALLGGPIAAGRILISVFSGFTQVFKFLRQPIIYLRAMSIAGGRFAGIAARLVPIFTRFAPMFLRLAGPVGIFLAFLPLIIRGLKALYARSPEFKKFVDNMVSGIRTVITWVREHLIAGFKFLVDFFQGTLLPTFRRVGGFIGDILIRYVVPALDAFFGAVNATLPVIGRIIGRVFGFIVDTAKWLWDVLFGHSVFPDMLEGFKTIFGAIASVVKVWLKVVRVYFHIAIAVAKFLFNSIKFLITRVFMPIWRNVLLPAIKLFGKIAGVIFRGVKVVAKFLFDGIKFYINNIFLPIWRLIFKAFRAFWELAKWVFGKVRDAWSNLMDGIRWVWEHVLRPVIDKIKDAFQSFREKIAEVIDAVRDKFNDFRSKLEEVRTWVVDKVNAIKDKFGEIREFIGDVFSNLGGVARSGINEFIDFLNHNLIGNLNKVTSKFGLTIPSIPRLATGGRVGDALPGGRIHGPGGPTDDRVPLLGSRDEYMIRAASAKRIGYDTLDYANRTGQLPNPTGGARRTSNPLIATKNTGGLGSFLSDKWDDIANLAKTGVGITLERLIDGVRGMMDSAGLAYQTGKGFTLPNLFHKILEKLGDVARNWGHGYDDEADQRAAPEGGTRVGTYTGPDGGWTYPLARRYPITQYPNAGHSPYYSVDIGAPTGTTVLAASSGVVSALQDEGSTSYGRWLEILHKRGMRTRYAHLKTWLTKIGATVKTGQAIAISNNTGGSTGPHLHFELFPSSNTVTAMAARGVRLAKGGVVPATPGGILAMIGEAGRNERVEPLDTEGFSRRDRAILGLIQQLVENNNSGKGNLQMNVYPSRGMDERELAEYAFRRAPFAMRKGS